MKEQVDSIIAKGTDVNKLEHIIGRYLILLIFL
jgi:hypothetical protein